MAGGDGSGYAAAAGGQSADVTDATCCSHFSPSGAGEIVPFDDGSLTADKAQSSAMSLVVNYAAPELAAGVAVFGLGLLVLPLFGKLGLVKEDAFLYSAYTTQDLNGSSGASVRLPLTQAELRKRFGVMDAASVAEEITIGSQDLDDRINRCDLQALENEVGELQGWRDKANTNLKALQKRSALAFMGLSPDADDADVGKMYKRMALELHPDKGGDPEKFQELQEMKERLVEIEKDEEQRKDMNPDDEEARRAKEREREVEDEQGRKLPPNERMKKIRMEVHDNAVRLWERAKKARDEITGDAKTSRPQKALGILKTFVDKFVNIEVKTLRHGDTKSAEMKLRKFIKQGAEIIAVAAMYDVQATLTVLAGQFNYRLVARSGSPEIKAKCANFLEAVAEVPTSAEKFLSSLEHGLADARDRERKEKERRAAEQRDREARGDYGGDAGKAGDTSSASSPPPGKQGSHNMPSASQPQSKGPSSNMPSNSQPPSKDPFAGFDFDGGAAPAAGMASRRNAAPVAGQDQLSKKDMNDRLATTPEKAKSWDPEFDHPYAGALYSNGQGIFCRPCHRWIQTYDYDKQPFLTHVERCHPKPPLGWPG